MSNENTGETDPSDPGGSYACRLCGGTVPERRRADDSPFCSPGCQAVHAALPESESGRDEGQGAEPSSPAESGEETETVFLAVEGMHSATCEAFLERVATGVEAVVAAEASYVTESIRVEYEASTDADALEAELVEELSTLEYTASPREAGGVTAGENGAADGVESVIGFRYAAGVVFTAFLMIPYLVAFYPAHLSNLLGREYALFAEGNQALVVLPVFLILTLVVLLFTGGPVLRDAYVALKLRQPNTGLLVSLTAVSAYLYGSAAFLAGGTSVYYDLAVVSLAVVTAAMFYESLVKRRAANALTELTVSRVSSAQRYEADGSTATVDVAELEPGDRVLVPEGERLPVDGTLVEGECTVDEAVVTGESAPVHKQAGDELIGGSVLTNGAAVIRVGENATSSIDRLTSAVWGFQSASHGAQRRANELAERIVPVLAVAAVVAAGATVAFGGGPTAVIVALLTVPLAGSPWVLGFATPLSTATSIEAALDAGIAVFDETVFERLRDAETVVFDKTGTLTTGEMEVRSADAPPTLLTAAAALEQRASHPAASAIVAAYGDGAEEEQAAGYAVESFTSHATGVEGVVDGTSHLVGTLDLFTDRGWTVSDDIAERATEARRSGQLPVVVGREGKAEGLVLVGDEARPDWETTLAELKQRGLEIVVLTGDDPAAAELLAASPHVEHVFTEVPPAGKAAAVRRLQTEGPVAMVGDGTNDAPALAAADLGLSLGSGTALAADAADLALVDDELSGVSTAFELSATAARRRGQNDAGALLYNAAAVPLALAGLLNPLLTMAAAVLSCGLVAANAFRDY
ncbi:MAG: heavy metal translocating P-type ATPase [Halolamina sp.]